MIDKQTSDKYGRPIRVGDVLKVFHFIGRRRKRHYMYKQVVRSEHLGGDHKTLYFFVSHLDLDGQGYWIGVNEGILIDYEIVQSTLCDHETRAKS